MTASRYERRFTGEIVEVSWSEMIRRWFRGEGWHPTKYVFTEIKPGEPGYDTAPYAEAFVPMEEFK
jgi:hypothetical protein